ncbi:MAG: hypothetical protein IJR07_05530 [Bacteroidaceae bacterium]|nr:hypothetical protein [Bacteroidaceae bacterium]
MIIAIKRVRNGACTGSAEREQFGAKLKTTFRLLMLMALPMVIGLTSCTDNDYPVDPNPLAAQVSGLWWSLADQEGTYSDAADSYPYTSIGQAICFNEDGTGYGVTFFFNDDEGDPIAIIGGESMAPFTYTSTADGQLSLNFDKAYKEYADYFKQWTMSYTNETVTATNGTLPLTLEKPSEAMAVLIHDWDYQFNGGLTPTSFNANTDFTADTWRSEEWIYIYDGVGSDHPTRNGFTIVALPWNTEHSEGTLQTNLPDGFCNDITPENGWELALNVCGKSTGGVKNNNFFALYNKYLGILRFFYFMPADFASGNDHVWQVSMGDNLAQHSLYGYGVPSDRSISNKAAIGQTGSDTYMEYVTPWVDYLSSDGLVTPNGGWWAFDVDLSMYRANANHDTKASIKLQMRSWDVHNTSLYSAMTANIDGTIKANLKLDAVAKKSSSTAKGVLMGLQAAAQAGSAIANFASQNWAGGLTSLGQMFGTGASLTGLGKDGGTTGYTGSLDGTISLGLDGNINTSGVIDGSKTITGIPSPTFSLSDFDLKNSHIGQGVWNLKTAPVVYSTNFTLTSGWPVCVPYFFNPHSIEVELNPNIFPESEIEWMQVDALCIARKSMQEITKGRDANLSTDNIRLAYDVNKFHIPYKDIDNYQNESFDRSFRGCLFDFLYNHEDKFGLKEEYYLEHETELNGIGNVYEFIVGRGNNDYAIEPQYYADQGERTFHVPFPEINVKVLVKMKGMQQPIVFSRNYLPDIKNYGDGTDFYNSKKKTRPYASKMNGHTNLYDYQMKRISDIITRYKLPEAKNIDLSTLNSNYVAKNAEILSGTLGKNVKISIADGATVTLQDVTINGTNSESYKWAGITCEGDATIIIKGANSVRGFYEYPGIYVPQGKTLTIKGDGSLNAIGNTYTAGIGAGWGPGCGNIIITGGTINATGGQHSAGIGGGFGGDCGNIIITSGVTSVTATKGEKSNYSIGAGVKSYCGTVTIGGKVTGNIETSPYTYKP